MSTAIGKLTSTRGGTIAVGLIVAVIAGILLLVYLNRYRSSVRADAAATPVLVADSFIPRGTSGSVIAQKELFRTQEFPRADVKEGAVVDPAYLNGRVAVADIYPGQQITTADVSSEVTDALPSKITGVQRALALQVNGARGLVGFVNAGDHVDVYYETGVSGGNALALLAQDVAVLRTPTKDDPVVLRANARMAQTLALASDTGTLWFLLRPAAGAKNPPRKLITTQDLLALLQRER